MTLIAVASLARGAVAGAGIVKGIKTGRNKGIELFGYDFTRLMTLLLMYFAIAWVIEVFMKARILVEKPEDQRAIGLGFLGIGGFLIEGLIRLFDDKNDQGEVITPINDTIRKLFDDGIEIGGFNLKYWDVIKAGAIMLIASEYFSYMDLSKLNDSKVNYMTHAVFGLLLFALGLWTLPKFTGQIQQVVNR